MWISLSPFGDYWGRRTAGAGGGKGGSAKKRPAYRQDVFGGGGWIRFSAEKPRRLKRAAGAFPRAAFRIRNKNAPPTGRTFLVEEGGFEPPKRIATDLQSAPFGHSGTPPHELVGAGGRTRTPDRLITNQLLYQLSYTSTPARPQRKLFYQAEGELSREKIVFSKEIWRGEWASGHRFGQTRCGTCSGCRRQGGAGSAARSCTGRNGTCVRPA